VGVKERLREAERLAADQFVRMARAGQVPVLDRFGNPLSPGVTILLHPAGDLVMKVKDIKPILDPTSPPGLVTVILECMETFGMAVGVPNRAVLLLQMPEAQQDRAPAGPLDAGEANGEGAAGEPLPPEDPPGGLVDEAGRPVGGRAGSVVRGAFPPKEEDP
jgi:hypothetical protein